MGMYVYTTKPPSERKDVAPPSRSLFKYITTVKMELSSSLGTQGPSRWGLKWPPHLDKKKKGFTIPIA